MTTEERFERIEATLERFAAGMEQLRMSQQDLRAAHMELEAAQVNQQRAHTKLEETLTSFIDETRERITNLTILVDRLVERDLGRSNGEM
jgi:hypothetical protein